MGNKEGKTLNNADLSNLENSTEFSRKDIRRWYKTFKKECTDNNMNLEDFQVSHGLWTSLIIWLAKFKIALLRLSALLQELIQTIIHHH